MTRRRGQVISMSKDYYALVEGGGGAFGFWFLFFVFFSLEGYII